MSTAKQSSSKRLKMAERAQQLMELHFPNIAQEFLWSRKSNDGYITIPRTLPIVMQVIDAQSKGQPAGHTLFCLWARSPDHAVVTIENPATFAAEAGFLGERAVDTWRRRMKTLREQFFIQTKPGASGEFHYVLLLNPNVAVEGMRNRGLVQDGLYSRFIERLGDIGAYKEITALKEFWVEYQKRQAVAETARTADVSGQTSSEAPPIPETTS